MKENSVRPKRTIHLTFVPDEEIGGLTGLAPFLETPEFKVLHSLYYIYISIIIF